MYVCFPMVIMHRKLKPLYWKACIVSSGIFRGYPAKKDLSAMRKHGGWGPFGRIPSIRCVCCCKLCSEEYDCIYHGNKNCTKKDICDMQGHPCMNPKVRVRVPLSSTHFLSQKLWNFRNNIRSCVENESCGPGTVNISNVNFIFKNIYTTRASIHKHGTANVWHW